MVPAVSVCDTSQFGTKVGGKADSDKVPKDCWTTLPPSCVLHFGTGIIAGRLQYVPLVACGAALDEQAFEEAQEQAAPLGIHLVRTWRDACTLALVPATCGASVPADATLACALYSGAPIVKATWLAHGAVWASEGKDPVSECDACAVAVTHPVSGHIVMPDVVAKFRSLLQGVTLVFGPPGRAANTKDVLKRALAPLDATLALAIHAAGGVACAVGGDGSAHSGDAASTAVAQAAAGGAAGRGILLVLPSAGTGAAHAVLRGTQWERCPVSDTGRVLATLLSGVLGSLQLPVRDITAQAAMPPPPARAAKAAVAEDSDTDDEGGGVQMTGATYHQGAPRVVVATQSTMGGVPGTQATTGFRPFDGGARAKRDREAAEAMGVQYTAPQPTAPKVPKNKRAAPRGHNAALALALQMDKREPEEEEDIDEGDGGYKGAEEYVPLITRKPPAYVVAPPVPQHEGPNFKRFRKVPILPSSASNFQLIINVVDAGRHGGDPEMAAETAKELAAEKAAARMFNETGVAVKPRAKKRV